MHLNDQTSTNGRSNGNHSETSSTAGTTTNRITNLLSGAATSAFGNLQEEADNPASRGTSSTKNDSKYGRYSTRNNGAKGLAAASQLHQQQQTLLAGRKEEIAKHKEDHKAQAQATQEDVRKKMKLVMSNPQLWLQFKSRLAASDHGGGSVGVQTVLQEFLANHPEIDEQLQQESQQQQAASSTNANAKSRRISILESVSNFTSDLSNEASMRGSLTSASFPAEIQKMHQEEQEERRSSIRSTGSAGDSDSSFNKGGKNFMNNASELGISFFRRASAVAASSLATSSSGFDSEAVPSSPLGGSAATSTIATKSPRIGSSSDYIQPIGKGGSNKVPLRLSKCMSDLLVPFNEQEEDGYVSTDGDDDQLEDDEMDALADEFEYQLNTSQYNAVARGA